MQTDELIWEVPAFLAHCNESLRHGFGGEIALRGEVASFKINQGKWVFFDLKEILPAGTFQDKTSSVSCFMVLAQLNTQIEDGMQVILHGTPTVTRWGKLSFTVREILPIGEGSIKKSFELLKAKLTKEGLFDPTRKRPLPQPLEKIGVISSTQAAGYADFVKILNERWGGLQLQVAHTQVQGLPAVEQIIRALKYFNERQEVQVIALLRGGGSADDLAIFNDERLVRAIAASRLPVITGIGHEIDESLADLAADLRASTPSNAAQMLSPDRHAEINLLRQSVREARQTLLVKLREFQAESYATRDNLRRGLQAKLDELTRNLAHARQLLESQNPDRILSQSYAIISGKLTSGNVVKITTYTKELSAEIKSVQKRE